jgi:hypothetical protein
MKTDQLINSTLNTIGQDLNISEITQEILEGHIFLNIRASDLGKDIKSITVTIRPTTENVMIDMLQLPDDVGYVDYDQYEPPIENVGALVGAVDEQL